MKFLKLNILIFTLAFSAGFVFLCCGFLGRVPSGAEINGIAVGGKPRGQAAELVRRGIEEELKTRSLKICGNRGEYVFTYPEIGYKDDLQKLVKTIKKGEKRTARVSFYLNGLSEIAGIICGSESADAVEPYAVFGAGATPFIYCAGADGCKADKDKLISDITRSLSGGFEDVRVKIHAVKRKTTLSQVKRDTRLLSTFTTYFDGNNLTRSHNIRLAAEKINGSKIGVGEIFSFNERVGERTAERGFKPAKIIEKGEFVEGVGGGVCQVSTTLYNAALLCGCKIEEYHPHSLSVSYVPPSFDAMVSGSYFDLKFRNLSGSTLYIRARTGESFVAFDVYGRSDGNSYFYESEITGVIPAPEERTDDISLVKDGRDGTESAGYLTVTGKDGAAVKRTLLRRDRYAPLKKIVLASEALPQCSE